MGRGNGAASRIDLRLAQCAVARREQGLLGVRVRVARERRLKRARRLAQLEPLDAHVEESRALQPLRRPGPVALHSDPHAAHVQEGLERLRSRLLRVGHRARLEPRVTGHARGGVCAGGGAARVQHAIHAEVQALYRGRIVPGVGLAREHNALAGLSGKVLVSLAQIVRVEAEDLEVAQRHFLLRVVPDRRAVLPAKRRRIVLVHQNLELLDVFTGIHVCKDCKVVRKLVQDAPLLVGAFHCPLSRDLERLGALRIFQKVMHVRVPEN
mmetsp:Transcript_22741/g.72860  ORF Transcript_22741/g.72860 Transcript_22741/m.72860 type:complete len:268 (+) Transcript_22741:449-1252(+)